jgi:predicted N-acyltransferase
LLARRANGRAAAAALCVGIGHRCAHTTYKPWEQLLGREMGELASDAYVGSPKRLQLLRSRLPVTATDALVCALPGATLPGILWDDALSEPASALAIDRVMIDTESEARGLGASVCAIANVRDEPRYAVLHTVLKARGYHAAVTAADAVMNVSHSTLDQFFASFRSQRRKSMRKERRQFLDAGVRVVAGAGPEWLTDDLAPLQFAHYQRYGHTVDMAAVLDRFTRVRTIPGLRVLRASLDGCNIGFIAFFVSGVDSSRIVGRLFGFADNRVAAYFNLTYYELLNYAMGEGIATIHYGSGSYEAKMARGCRLVPLSMHVKALQPAAAAIADAASFRDELERHRLAALHKASVRADRH